MDFSGLSDYAHNYSHTLPRLHGYPNRHASPYSDRYTHRHGHALWV
jgi:hypothetical protein